jgi:sulfate transport system permease protein
VSAAAATLVAGPARRRWRKPSVLPGFGPALGFTLVYLSLIVVLPLGALTLRAAGIGWTGFWEIALDDRVVSALRLSFASALLAALINVVFGTALAWTLARYRFFGRRLLDAAVDLPFAMPTAVAGIALAALYAPSGPFGAALGLIGVQVGFTPLGVTLALVFVGLPFVVRTVQPVIEDLDRETEEAAVSLGAGRLRTLAQVVLPALGPAVLTGFALAFARGVGEYGSVIFIAGNLPHVSEIAPLLIVIRLEEFDTAGATVIAVAMLAISFSLLFLVNFVQGWSRRRFGHG